MSKLNKTITQFITSHGRQAMKKYGKKTVVAIALAAAFTCTYGGDDAGREENTIYAASATSTPTPTPTPTGTTSVTATVNYLKSTITLSGNTSSKIYISTNKGKTWDVIETGTVLDLDCYMKTSAVTLYFKASGDTGYYTLEIPKPDSTLKATYSVTDGEGELTLNTTSGVEYRKGDYGDWTTYSSSTFSTTLYEYTGFTFQFRIKATSTTRAGKVISVKIPKKTSAPSITIDYSKLLLKGLKSGKMQYRLSTSTTWTDFTVSSGSSSLLDMYTVLNGSTSVDKATTALKSGIIEVRVKSTDKKVASAIRVLEIPAMQDKPTSETVAVSGDTLCISDASAKNPYQYTIVHLGETYDMTEVTWKKVTSTKTVSLKKFGSKTTVTGDVVYVRKASYKDSSSNTVTMPSLPYKVTLTITSTTPTPTP